MKKKYFIISFLIIFLLTGCKSKYSLEIKDKTIKETLTITDNSDNDNVMEKDDLNNSFVDYSYLYGEKKDIDTNVENYYSGEECIGSCTFYQKELINDNGLIGFKLTNTFSFDNFQSSTIANELIPAFSSIYDGRYIKISGGSRWNYFKDYKYLENVEINIDTEYQVVSTNMNKVGAGKYKKDLSEDDGILYIVLDTNYVLDLSNINKKDNTIKYLFVILIALFVGLLFCIFKERKKYR